MKKLIIVLMILIGAVSLNAQFIRQDKQVIDTLYKKHIINILKTDSLKYQIGDDEKDIYGYEVSEVIPIFKNDQHIISNNDYELSLILTKFYKVSNPLERENIFKKNNIPLLIESVWLGDNIIGNPELNIRIRNISEKDIDAYDISVYCYDRYGKPVSKYHSGSNLFIGTSQDVLYSGFRETSTWTLYGQELTTKVKVFIDKVHFTNGKTLNIVNKQLTKVEGKLD